MDEKKTEWPRCGGRCGSNRTNLPGMGGELKGLIKYSDSDSVPRKAREFFFPEDKQKDKNGGEK